MPEYSPINGRKKLFQRQFPTVLGLVILVVGLAVGIFFFKDGFNGFAPRATPQTTPKNIKVTNVLADSFSVSFSTDEATPGFVKYGTDASSLKSQAGDDRDQLSGSVGSYTLHQISVRGLTPNTNYYFVLGSGSGSEFDNQGAPFTQKTGQAITDNSASKTIYGNVVTVSGGPAEGAIVYVKADSSGELSAIVKSSGSWVIPLNTARTIDGSAIAPLDDSSNLTITVQGLTSDLSSQLQTTVGQAQPVATITLGGTNDQAAALNPLPSPTETPATDLAANSANTASTTATDSGEFSSGTDDLSGLSADDAALNSLDSLANLASSSGTVADASVVDLTKVQPQTVATTQPVITGKAAPNVTVSIQVHSDTAITQQLQSDSSGNFSLDIASLSQNLDPGQHTVTYSYVDPTTGQTVTKTQTFTVADKSSTGTQLALANTGSGSTSGSSNSSGSSAAAQPFGSGNPFPADSTPLPTPTLTPTPTPDLSASSSSTLSGRTSQPSTGSGIPVSGSTGTTIALIMGGIFFILAGAWSFWVAQHLHSNTNEEES